MIGHEISHYRVLGNLGEGGMGEVYRAEDTELGREVALKVLPDRFVDDSRRLARFRREARSVAALSHPNIVTLHSVDEVDGTHFLTMELVEGRTLEEVIPPDGLPIDRFYGIAVQLADAVAAAHTRGIVHRDLKPANVMVTDEDRVKILDFGLAALRPETSADAATLPETALTENGQVLGTVVYMAPEQLRGESADERSDVFALGTIMHEMATGRRAFDGSSHADIASAVLRDDPAAVDTLRPELPRHLGRLIGLCLKKDPRDRLQTALDLRNELRELRSELEREAVLESEQRRSKAAAEEPTGDDRRRWTLLVVVPLLIALAGLAAWFLWPDAADESPLGEPSSESTVGDRRLSQVTFGAEVEEWPAWSPDGETLAYVAEIDGYKNLFARDLESGEETRLTTHDRDDIQPTWWPDGSALLFSRSRRPDGRMVRSDVYGYFYDSDIWRLEPDGGSASRLLQDAVHPTISPDGKSFAFAAPWAGPWRIWRADARGHNPRQLTTDVSEAVVHTAPSWSPDGSHVVYRRIENTVSDLELIDVESGRQVRLTDDVFIDLDPAWASDGESIVFSSYRGGGLNLWRLPIGGDGEPLGAPLQLTTGAGPDLHPAVNPIDDRVAFAVVQLNTDLWRLPVDPETAASRGKPEAVVATTREESRGAWSPDGSSIAFNSDRSGEMNIWRLVLPDGVPEQVTSGAGGDYQPQWSPDGERLVFFSSRSGNADIWEVRLADGALTALTEDPGLDINPFYSPDGGRIAFQSDRTGQLEVWGMEADGSGQRQLTDRGTTVHFLAWTPDGGEIYFRAALPLDTPENVYRVDVESGESRPFLEISSGAHISFSPDRSVVLDVSGHKTLLAYPRSGEPVREIFGFEDSQARIDYPVWSPDGRWVLFDRSLPRGGDIWLLELPDS